MIIETGKSEPLFSVNYQHPAGLLLTQIAEDDEFSPKAKALITELVWSVVELQQLVSSFIVNSRR